MNAVLHSSTKNRVAAYLKNPPHALLITGPYGVGASSLAHSIAKQISATIITVLPEKDDTINLDKGIISVDLIRRLYEQTRTIIDSRVVIIDYAERMAPASQNAFLKLLEEPNSGTMFILVTHEPAKLLPTILSRVQALDMQPITEQQSLALLDTLAVTDATKRTQLLYIAMGLPARLTRLVQDQAYFEASAQSVRDARDLLQSDTYTQLLLAQRYKDNRLGSLQLLEIAMNILRRSLTDQPEPATIKKLNGLLNTYDRIAANGNIRLQLARAVLY
jgi:DNA polymerase III subunit delta'